MQDRNTPSRRRFLQATGSAAAALAVAGCLGGSGDDASSESNESPDSETEGSDGGTLQLTNATMSTLDPIAATDTASGEVIQQVFDCLMTYPNGEIEVETQLASDYEVSEDFTTYTFHLKEGVTFHDGREVTAQDFVYSWERLAASDNSMRAYYILDTTGVSHETQTVTEGGEERETYEPGTLGIEAVDDYTLEVRLDQPFHSALAMFAYTSFAVLPEGVLGDVEGYDGEMDHSTFATENPIGAGPFEFENWEADTEVSVVRFDDYHGRTAAVERVHWNVTSDDNAAYNYAMNRNADVFNMPTAKYDPAKLSVEGTDDLGRETGTYGPARNGETLNYVGVPTNAVYYVGFNTQQVEKPVRQAMAYALNQRQVLERVFKGRGEPAYHFTPPQLFPGGPDGYDEHAQQYPYGREESKLDEARSVLEDAGYGPDQKAQVTFTVYESSSTWEELAKLLRDQLSSAHVDMTIESAPFSTLIERGQNGNLEAYSMGWLMGWPAADNFLQMMNPPRTDTSSDDFISFVNWSDTEAADAAAEAWQTVQDNPTPTDEAQQKREEAYRTMEEANWEDVAFLPAYHNLEQRFWYDGVDYPKFGSAGYSRVAYNTVEKQ